jgi:hypothetical protein
MLVGALVGIPGAAYLSALDDLVTGKSSTATQVVAVVIFVLIEFSLVIIPFVFLELRPEATKAALKNAQDWLLSHARQLMAYTALILGAYGLRWRRVACADVLYDGRGHKGSIRCLCARAFKALAVPKDVGSCWEVLDATD